jgi:hypothetical protein
MGVVFVWARDAHFALDEGSLLISDGGTGLLLQMIHRVGIIGTRPGRNCKFGF